MAQIRIIFQFLLRIPPRGKRLKFIEATKIFQFLLRIPLDFTLTKTYPDLDFQFLLRIPPKPYTIQLWLYLTISSESLRLLSNSGFLGRFSGKLSFRTLSVPQNLYIGVPGEILIFCSSKQGPTPHHPPAQARRKPAPRAASSEATCQASPPATLLSSCATREISDRGTRRSPC